MILIIFFNYSLFSDRSSFLNIPQWVEDVRAERGSSALIMLVGNKTDLTEKRQVSQEEGEQLAKDMGLHFIETSAKTSFNVKNLFRKLALSLPRQDNIGNMGMGNSVLGNSQTPNTFALSGDGTTSGAVDVRVQITDPKMGNVPNLDNDKNNAQGGTCFCW
jgi:GTPase SAR1 family protein